MQEPEIYTQLTEIFRDVFMREDMTLAAPMSAKDVQGWDSYKHIEIIIGIEEHYGIKFHTKELDKLQNVGDIVQAVMAKKTS
jgi:acyl carrier protein